jgi:hypothetical protein
VTARTRALRAAGDAKARRFAAAAEGTAADLVVLRGGRGLTDHYLDVALSLPPADAAPGRRLRVRLLRAEAGGASALAAHPC